VLPEGSEPRVLRAAAEVSRRGLADLILLGSQQAIRVRGANSPLHLYMILNTHTSIRT
jgi:phosphotransacetylase